MKAKKVFPKKTWLYRNGLSVTFISLFVFTLLAQAITGWKEHNSELSDQGASPISFNNYLHTGHFISATFENFESEFLQMVLYVLLTVKLRQIGSAESKKLDEEEAVDREPVASKNAPWPVRQGGLILKLYSNSLSIAFCILFLVSWYLHFYGSWLDHNAEQILKGKATDKMTSYLGQANFCLKPFKTGRVNSSQ